MPAPKPAMTKESLLQACDTLDEKIVAWMARHSVQFLRLSLGTVFFWFGVLKFFPGMSPAQELATRTIHVLTFGLVPAHITIMVLASWECVIGLGLLTNKFMRATLFLLFVQMLGTLTPLFLFPSDAFQHVPYSPTLEGQYIIKNLVLISAGIAIGATVRTRDRLASERKTDERRRNWVRSEEGV